MWSLSTQFVTVEFDKLILKLQEKGREPTTAKAIVEKRGEGNCPTRYFFITALGVVLVQGQTTDRTKQRAQK